MSSGLYLHYPFCKQKCYYCDFVSITDLSQQPRHLSLLIKEKQWYDKIFQKEEFNSLYIGGGTPSLLPSDEWEYLAGWKNDTLPDIVEFTIEANPESVNPLFLSQINMAGCNRISIGIQSMDETVLKELGRIHNTNQAYHAVENAKKRIKQVSLDFMIGLPGETWQTIEKNCHFIQTFQPDHLSLYFLSIPSETIFYQKSKMNPSWLPDEQTVMEWWQFYLDVLHDLGYQHYEISNFSQPGCESIHNQHYWARDPYLGLGVHASSYFPERRWTNEPSFFRYCQNVLLNAPPVYLEEVLESDTIQFEKIMLGLRRLNIGIPENLISTNKTSVIDEMITQNWLIHQNKRLYVTESGCLWLDTIIKKLA